MGSSTDSLGIADSLRLASVSHHMLLNLLRSMLVKLNSKKPSWSIPTLIRRMDIATTTEKQKMAMRKMTRDTAWMMAWHFSPLLTAPMATDCLHRLGSVNRMARMWTVAKTMKSSIATLEPVLNGAAPKARSKNVKWTRNSWMAISVIKRNTTWTTEALISFLQQSTLAGTR